MLKCKFLFFKRSCSGSVINDYNVCLKNNKPCLKTCKDAVMVEYSGSVPTGCKFMTDTGKPKIPNYPCKGNAITCSHPEIGEQAPAFMTTKKCNPQNCKYFQSMSAQFKEAK